MIIVPLYPTHHFNPPLPDRSMSKVTQRTGAITRRNLWITLADGSLSTFSCSKQILFSQENEEEKRQANEEAYQKWLSKKKRVIIKRYSPDLAQNQKKDLKW